MTSSAGGRSWARLREPDDPYDGEDEEKTPRGAPRLLERCRPCQGSGVIHVIRSRRQLERARRCPFCRGRGFRIVESDR